MFSLLVQRWLDICGRNGAMHLVPELSTNAGGSRLSLHGKASCETLRGHVRKGSAPCV